MQEQLRDTDAGAEWDRLHPVLDDVMHELNEADRNAILARYFEGRPLAAIGEAQGVSADGARMRVTRALEKLRVLLERRGITSTAAGLGLLFAEHAVSAAPAGLSAQIAGAALAGSAGGTLTFLNLMASSKLAIASVVLAASLATSLVVQTQTQRQLREEVLDLRRQNEALALAAAKPQTPPQLPSATPAANASQNTELLRLRGEVTRLRLEAAELAKARHTAGQIPGEATLQVVSDRVAKLAQKLEEMPEKKIPELQFLTYRDWLNAVWDAKELESDEAVRDMLSYLRQRAKGLFGTKMVRALKACAEANAGQIPNDIAALGPYFNPAIDATILQRYKVAQSGDISTFKNEYLIVEIAPPVDEEHDTILQFSREGTMTRSYSAIEEALDGALAAYAAAHGGLLPEGNRDLDPYLQRKVDPARAGKFLGKIPAGVKTLAQFQAATAR
jgi:hypothetical protein